MPKHFALFIAVRSKIVMTAVWFGRITVAWCKSHHVRRLTVYFSRSSEVLTVSQPTAYHFLVYSTRIFSSFERSIVPGYRPTAECRNYFSVNQSYIFYRASSYASALLAVVILSVRLSITRVLCGYFDTHEMAVTLVF